MKSIKFLLALILVLGLTSVALTSCMVKTDSEASDENDGTHEHIFVAGKCECGAEDLDYVPPHTHNFIDGECECGEKDPEYVPPHEHVFVDGRCECGAEAIVPPSLYTISDVISAELGSTRSTTGTVVGVNAQSFLLADETGMILVYNGKDWKVDVAVGDEVVVESGTTATYGGAVQFAQGSVYSVVGKAPVDAPAPITLTAEELDSYISMTKVTPVYVRLQGTLSVSGSYYNLAIDGAQIIGSITYPIDAEAIKAISGEQIVIEGYITGVVNKKYLNVLASYVTLYTPSDGEHEHVFVDGKCECGEADPNYTTPGGSESTYETVTISELLSKNENKFYNVRATVSALNYTDRTFTVSDGTGTLILGDIRSNIISATSGALDSLGIKVGDTVVVGVKASSDRCSYLIANETAENSTAITVSSPEELVALANKINSGELSGRLCIRLGADIDMAGIAYTPIKEFRGVFDGCGHKISNLTLPLDGATISLTDGNWVGYTVTTVGLFGSAYDSTIKNLTLENVSAVYNTTTEVFIGALVGYSVGVVVDNCSVSSDFELAVNHSSISAKSISGISGLIGYSLGAYTKNTTVNTEITYSANSYEAFVGAVLGVGNVCVRDSVINLDISFVGTRYGHTGSVIGMERTPDEATIITVSSMYGSTVTGTLRIDNPSGYAWGEVGQGWFQHPDTREIQDLAEHNTIRVEVN